MRGLADQELGKKCIWLKRNITDIEQQKPSKELSRFTECNGPIEKVKTFKTLLEDLKGDLSRKLPSENILSYNITWQEKGLNPGFKEHSDYLDKITDDAEKKLKQLTDDMIRADKKNKQDNLRLEVKQHLLFCQSKCADFKGKEDTLKAVHNYIKSDKRHPLVIHGESGSGKTSLMAMIAKKANEWLGGKATVVIRKQRRLTQDQEDLLYKSYDQCPVPLYLNLCFLKASQWTSYIDVSSIQLYQTVREAINGLFAKLEKLHGYDFVSKTLGYLTAAKLGLTETELEDILACDDDVLNDVYEYWTPPIRRLPPLLLVRLRHDLQQYLVERGADGATVIYWYHRQFIEAAQDRYCRVTNLHTALADYFLGTWANGTYIYHLFSI
ncbi:NACHT domain- and WD repeat-containing protein 1 [Mytilus coruscus]|uniref:NACHT domain- and WD repeat-containing protein 1 n=1 Tax=Mytilus coruscus TaxID=42192 RepID=A0A6J7ZZS9_MYTCO|nr:NACHT domain- and WD repeat-containing protein 1 [Mytilus coruscus]